MSTTWKSSNEKSTNQKFAKQETNTTISGTTLSSWSRQQKIAMIASFAILGLLLAVAACSKQSANPAPVGVSSPIPALATPAPTPLQMAATTPPTSLVATTTPTKKTPKKRPANVTYNDTNSGISFLYPRKAQLTAGDKMQPELTAVGEVPMNFAQTGGIAVAAVALPGNSYPGTDFASAFFNVNINRNVSEQECSRFAFLDIRDSDAEPIDAEKVKVGSTEMETTSNFFASAAKQAETQYYHSYANGACYEYVLGLGTQGFTTEGNLKHVDRDQVFAKLEQILATVKINPVEQEQVAEAPTSGLAGGKE